MMHRWDAPASAGIEIRAVEGSENLVSLRGYALRWDETSEIYPGFYERFAKGAFHKKAIEDTRFLVGHQGQPLARTKSETMTIREDDKGLLVEPVLDIRDPEAASLVRKVERGDLDGQSVGFSMREGKSTFDYADDHTVTRTIVKVGKLIEVSAVYNPAYTSSTLGTRELRSRTADAPEDVIAFLERSAEASPDLGLERQKAVALRTRLAIGGRNE